MNPKLITKCTNCGEENSVHSFKCKKCKSFLRTRVVNINIGDLLIELIFSPFKALRKVLYAEHKNFVIPMFALILIRLSFFIMTLGFNIFGSSFRDVPGVLLLVQFGIVVITIVVWTTLTKFVLKLFEVKFKWWDLFAGVTYSMFPLVLMFIVFILEISLFGVHWIVSNPAPFFVDPDFTYAMWGLEVIVLIWSIIASSVFYYTLTENKLFGVIYGIISIIVIQFLPVLLYFMLPKLVV